MIRSCSKFVAILLSFGPSMMMRIPALIACMLKPRIPLSPPPPQTRVRIGTHIVDLSAREVIDPAGTHTRITAKAQGVITELAVNPGQVLSRDELLDRVWTGAFPTGDVLTQAVTSLRRVFGDDAEAPRYIETISKSGYRLIAPVQWLPPEARLPPGVAAPERVDADTAPLTLATRTPARRRSGLWIAAMALALVTAALAWRSQDRGTLSAGGHPVARTRPVVIVAGTGDEWGARLSPDGATVVFVSSKVRGTTASLYVQSAMVATPTALTHPQQGERDLVPTWAPDGRSIVFQRHSDQAACKLMLVPATGGMPRQLGLCPSDGVFLYDWSPDGRYLVMGARPHPLIDAFSIQRFELATGVWSALDYETRAGNLDLEPRYSPDGKWLAFRRNISAADIWRMPSAGGKPERLTRIANDIRGFDWSPDSSRMVFSSIGENGLELFELDIASGAVTSLGIENASFPDFPLRGGRLVYEINRGQLGLAELVVADANAAATRVFSSSGNELNAEIAPDASAVAFYSDRSGKLGAWVAALPGDSVDAAQRVDDLMPIARFNPVWSADASRFLVIGFGEQGSGLYEVDRQSLRAVLLDTPFGSPRCADYLDDGRLIVASISGETQTLWVTERQGNVLKPQRRLDDVVYARVQPGTERIYFIRSGQAGLWLTDPALQSTTRVLDSWPSIGGYKMWTFLDQQLMLIDRDARLEPYRLMSWPLQQVGGAPTLNRELGDIDILSVGAFSPGTLVVTEAYGNGRDIGMLADTP
jgi:Tol biopolymer transport system component/DNA-binding winged helix-turn-helix (wHTH) protein